MMASPAPKPGLSRFLTSPRPVSADDDREFAVLDRRGDPQLALRLGVGVDDGVRGGLRDREPHGRDPFGIHAAVVRQSGHLAAQRADCQRCAGNSSPRTRWPSGRPTRARPCVDRRQPARTRLTSGMRREGRQRVAMNEATFRKVNEGMEVGQDPSGLLTFICECGRLGCNKLIQLTRAEYEGIRDEPTPVRDPRRPRDPRGGRDRRATRPVPRRREGRRSGGGDRRAHRPPSAARLEPSTKCGSRSRRRARRR